MRGFCLLVVNYWLYCLNPESSRKDILEKNPLAALNSVPLESIFSNRSWRFMDAYKKGLNGHDVAWAARKYCSHRIIPETLMVDREKAKM
ncbi:hypothetical protein K443DRAFT_93247 [Laccaria amethystina LaAM-08-1]|uniref:Uncharacterized protein n=1 Tax=Laccaria amethystina LaAM-08-1 TaxID=1095629 RepID=A0A0C9Y2P4_9AGAR|nr:hypothetical protein K443DRAFT_93247 [Laccaria amethystina LaAM-08-1]